MVEGDHHRRRQTRTVIAQTVVDLEKLAVVREITVPDLPPDIHILQQWLVSRGARRSGARSRLQPDRAPLYHALIENRPQIDDGRMRRPEAPGWGLALDRQVEWRLGQV